MPRTLKLSVVVSALFLLFIHTGAETHAQAPALSWDGLIEHVTEVPFSLNPSPDGSSYLPRHAVSADGRYVVFTSDATNLGQGYQAVLLRDRHTGDIQPIFPAYGLSDLTMSADGSQIAFRECDPARRPDYASICDVWVYNRVTNMMSAMSTMSDGTLSDADSGLPVLSSNGRFVVFQTNATNLLPPGAAPGQLIIRDRDADGNGIFDEPGTATIGLVSAADGSLTAGNGVSDGPEVSDDGRYVAFRSAAGNLVEGDSNGSWNVFERDLLTAETRLLDRRVTGEPSPVPVDRPEISMSADGRYVAFASPDGFLTGGDYDASEDVFVYDRDTQALSRITLPDVTADALAVDSPMLTADGRYVAMRAWSQNTAVPFGDHLATAIFVHDRTTGTSTKVSVLPDGSDLNWHAATPVISADGTVVLFTSKASNVQPGLEYQFDKIFAAVHFDVQPTEIHVPGRGGPGTYTVTTQQHTRWSASWDWEQQWFAVQTPWWNNAGSGPITFATQWANSDPVARTITVTLGSRTVTFTQGAGLSFTSITPNVGPLAGGTAVTIHGTGFEPGMQITTNSGGPTPAEFVDETTLHAVMPPGQNPGWTYMGVWTSDFRAAFMDNAFRYQDGTPPFIWSSVTGQQGSNDWYTSNVTIEWGWWDGDSAITSTLGCDPVVVTADTPGTTFTCSVTSEGGTATNSVTIKRDATPPVITMTTPAPTIYTFGSNVPAVFTCTDATSGSAGCLGDDHVDTSWSGLDHQFYVTAYDQAGNLSWTMVNYDVSVPFCWPPPETPRAWWRMEGDTTDLSGGLTATAVNLSNGAFVPAITGQGFLFPNRTAGFLQVGPSPRLDFDNLLTIAMWIKPADATPGVLLSHPSQYTVQRLADGSVQWTFHKTDGSSVSATIPGAAPVDVWTHLAVTFDHGAVRTWVNGRMVRFDDGTGALRSPDGSGLTIGGQDQEGSNLPFAGAIDELQLFDFELLELNLYLTGSHGMCVPAATTLTVNVPSVVDYGTVSYPAGAQLLDASQQPIAGKSITLSSGAASATLVTDSNGSVSWVAPASFGSAGTYANAFTAVFEGDTEYQRASVSRDIVVQKITPEITWPSPADIVYGTPLGAAQLNASANVAGTFVYTPPSGTVPGAGTPTLSVTFHPSDSTDYNDASSSVAMNVLKTQPAMTMTGGTFTYNGQPHPASASASDYLGQPLLPLTITYNGSSAVPVNAGSYTAVASYAGDGNYLGRSVSATIDVQRAPLTITAVNAAKLFGAPLPSFSAAASGFVNGESMTSLSGSLSFSTTATASSPVGAYAVTPGGLTSANYAITFASGTLTVTPAASQVAASASANPSGFGQAVTFTALVSIVSPGAGTPTGTVEFRDGTTRLGTVALSNGSALLTTNGFSAGAHNISAIYSGNANVTGSTQSFTQTVRASAQSSTTALSSSANPVIAGASVTLTATVTAPAGLSGNVAFYDGTALIGAAAVSGTKAKLVISTLAIGTHAITARYMGNATIPPSISPVFAQIVKASSGTLRNSTATVVASPSPGTLDHAVTFTATVAGNQSTPPTGGVLIFVDGFVVGGPVTLSPNGAASSRATFSTSTLAHGVHDVTVAYLGDGTYKGDVGTATLTIN